MKMCPECATQVPDKLIVCPYCCARRSRAAMRTLQMEPLRKVKAKTADLTIRMFQNKRHIQLFGAEQTFCGLMVNHRDKKSYATWEPIDVCLTCRLEVAKIMEEVCQPSA
jgi:hypothetical protein